MADTMTPRQRWLACLRLEPVDRLPFWPKLNGSYIPYQDEPWRSRTVDEVHEYVGSDLHKGCGAGCRAESSKVSIETEQDEFRRRVIYKTPSGQLEAEWKYDAGSNSWHPVVFPVKTVEDVEIMQFVYEDEHYERDEEAAGRAREQEKEIGQSALVASGHGVSPLMDWIQHIAGPENGHYLLVDHREEVESLFEARHRRRLEALEIILETTPADAVYSTENTSTTLISPDMFRRYSKPHLIDYGRMIEAAGKHHILHMCGKLKQLLPDIAEVPASAIEAFTSPPVGSTTLVDGRTDCPEMCFIGGTNATLWLEPAEVIIETIRNDLDVLPHTRGIVVTSAGVMPPPAPPDRIRRVAEWVRQYRPR